MNTIAMYRAQRGAALFSALIILVIVLIIGVSGVHVTAKEIKMAKNLEDEVIAFQRADSVVVEAIDNDLPLRQALNNPCADQSWQPGNTVTNGTADGSKSKVVVAYQGESLRPGYSTDEFDVHALDLTGSNPASQAAKATVVQRVTRLAPPSQNYSQYAKTQNCQTP
jgi:Tfp pilus assembly protein PilX